MSQYVLVTTRFLRRLFVSHSIIMSYMPFSSLFRPSNNNTDSKKRLIKYYYFFLSISRKYILRNKDYLHCKILKKEYDS